jgi:hypothetical protein
MAGSTLGELKIDGRTYSLDELTLGELEGLEDHMGLPLSQIDINSARAMRYLVYTVKLREEPGYTLELAGQVRVVDLLPQDDDERPTEEAAVEVDAAELVPTAG